MALNYAVYTGLFGNYESLNEVSCKRLPSTRYVCFTDSTQLRSKTWDIIVTHDDSNPIMASRRIKFFGHQFFPRGARTLYVDNTVNLRIDGSIILNDWLKDKDLAFMKHYSRANLRNEFFACSFYGMDEQKLLFRQFQAYCKSFPRIMSEEVYWGGMIAKINCDATDKLMNTWYEEYCKFSKRDQLSLKVALRREQTAHRLIIESNAQSVWHQWPIYNNRKFAQRGAKYGLLKRKFHYLFNAVKYGFRYFLPIRGNY